MAPGLPGAVSGGPAGGSSPGRSAPRCSAGTAARASPRAGRGAGGGGGRRPAALPAPPRPAAHPRAGRPPAAGPQRSRRRGPGAQGCPASEVAWGRGETSEHRARGCTARGTGAGDTGDKGRLGNHALLLEHTTARHVSTASPCLVTGLPWGALVRRPASEGAQDGATPPQQSLCLLSTGGTSAGRRLRAVRRGGSWALTTAPRAGSGIQRL